MTASRSPDPGDRSGGLSPLTAALAVVSSLLGVAVSVGTLGVLALPLAVGALVVLVASILRSLPERLPELPRPRLAVSWLREAAGFLGESLVRTVPHLPFLAPLVVYTAVTVPLAPESRSLDFQQQASEVIIVLLIGFALEAGAIRWRGRPVDWVLSLTTVVILIAGEAVALASLATEDSSHADVVAGSMAAGVAAILIAAVQGALAGGETGASRPSSPPSG